MIISDLQHIETANETEVQGGYGKGYGKYYYYKPAYNVASAGADATAIGYNTRTSTYTNAQVVQGGGSSSSSGAFAETF